MQITFTAVKGSHRITMTCDDNGRLFEVPMTNHQALLVKMAINDAILVARENSPSTATFRVEL